MANSVSLIQELQKLYHITRGCQSIYIILQAGAQVREENDASPWAEGAGEWQMRSSMRTESLKSIIVAENNLIDN